MKFKFVIPVVFILSLLSFHKSEAQNYFNVFGLKTIDEDKGIYQANYFLLDTSGGQLSTIKYLDSAKLSISLNALSFKILGVKQQKAKNVKSVRMLLVLDISGSMSGQGLEWAINSAQNLVDLAPDNFRIGIMVFNHESYLLQDFTNDKELLKDVLNSLFAFGGTDFNEPIYQNKSASIKSILSKQKADKKIAIFLTDGYGFFSTNSVKVLAKDLKNSKISFYPIGMNTFLPDELVNLSEATSGFATTFTDEYSEVKNFFQSVLLSTYVTPGNITFMLQTDSCMTVQLKNPYLTFSTGKVSTNVKASDIDAVHTVSLSASLLDFGYVPKGLEVKKEFYIKSIGIRQRFMGFELQNSEEFSLTGDLHKGQIMEPDGVYRFTLTYKPRNTLFKTTKIRFKFEKCPDKILTIYSGKLSKDISFNSLKVEKPNGGEVFFMGQTTTVEWSGASEDDTVEIYLSLDGGSSYKYIGKGSGLAQNIVLPAKLTDKGRVKIVHNLTGYKQYSRKILKFRNPVLTKDYKVAGKVSRSQIGMYNYLSANFGFAQVPAGRKRIANVKANPHSKYIAAYTSNKVFVYDNKMRPIAQHKFPKMYNVSVVSDSILVVFSKKHKIYLWNLTTGKIKKYKFKYLPRLNDCIYSPAENKLIATTNNYLYSLDLNEKKKSGLHSAKVIHRNQDSYIVLDHDNMILEIGFDKTDTLLANYKKLGLPTPNDIAIYDNKLYILKRQVHVFDLETGTKLLGFTPSDNFKHIEIMDNGYRIVLTNFNQVEVWSDMSMFAENDASDDDFEIREIDVWVKDKHYMRPTLTQYTTTEVFHNALVNLSPVKVKVTDVKVVPLTNAKFYLGNPLTDYDILPNKGYDLEITYVSDTMGIDSADVFIALNDTVFRTRIYASSIDPYFSLLTQYIDMGTVPQGKVKYKTVPVLQNNSVGTLRIKKAIVLGNSNNFDLPDNLDGYELKPGETLNLKIGLLGNDVGYYQLVLNFIIEGVNVPLTVTIAGRVVVFGSVKYNVTVRDAMTDRPVNSAVITAQAGKGKVLSAKTRYTNSRGFAQYRLKVDGQYDFNIRKSGYYPENYSITVPKKVYTSSYDTTVYLIKQTKDTALLYTFHFNTGQSNIIEEDFNNFQDKLRFLKRSDRIYIVIEGHTDNEGTETTNSSLSLRRAKQVRNFLIRSGIEPKRISVKAFSDKRPVADNSTEEGKQKNRRVEVRYYIK